MNDSIKEESISNPIIPYFGSKRKTAYLISDIIKDNLTDDSTYFEPFIGAGAVFLELGHHRSVIGDIVEPLITMYEAIKEDPWKVIEIYDRLPRGETNYYNLREFDRNPNFKRTNKYFQAARFIFLSKHSYGGARFNQLGQFNQSYGKNYDRPLYTPETEILELHKALQTTEINLASFEETIKSAKEGDVVYFDPPYIDSSRERYWLTHFREPQMEEVKAQCDLLDERDVKFLLSHSKNEFVKDLFGDYTTISLETYKNIKFQHSGKSKFSAEYLITNINNLPNLRDSITNKIIEEEN